MSKGLSCSIMDFYILCLHLLHTPVANSSPREHKELLITFEGISSGMDRGEENALATRHWFLHDYKYPRAAHLLIRGKPGDSSIALLPLHAVCLCLCDRGRPLGGTESKDVDKAAFPVFYNSSSKNSGASVPIHLPSLVQVTWAAMEQGAHNSSTPNSG